MSTVKLIVVPGRGVDLFSLKKSFGIKKGPVKTPIALPIEAVAELVNQYNRPEIFEVVLESIQKYPTELKIYSTPVLLTPDNYKLSYHEIAGVEPIEVTVETAPAAEVVKEEEETFQEPVITGTTDEKLPEEPTKEEEVKEDTQEADPTNEEATQEVEGTDEEVDSTTDEEKEVDDAQDPILVAAANKNKNSHKNSNKRG